MIGIIIFRDVYGLSRYIYFPYSRKIWQGLVPFEVDTDASVDLIEMTCTSGSGSGLPFFIQCQGGGFGVQYRQISYHIVSIGSNC